MGVSSHTFGHPHDASVITVPDAHLLFSGDYKRAGFDLVLSKDGHDYTVHDYFRGHSRATLASPDGAHLTGDLINALTGEVQVAQASGATAAAAVIGRVTKLTGSATAIRNGVSIQLNIGDNVNKGDVVQAGADSSLGLTFIDGTVFGLSSNARMVLNEMVYDPNGTSNSSLLSLVQGTITFVAGETAKHGDMKVDTPVATMGIRGTAVLVEIDFSVPGQGGAPPVKFSVLVEPGGHVGSYFLYSKTDPNQIIGQVNQSGQVTSVDGAGDTTTTQAPPLTPVAQAIIQQTLQEYFPNYVPGFNPRGTTPLGGSTPPAPVPGSSNPDPLKFQIPDLQIGVPTVIPISLPGGAPATPPIDVTVTRLNSTPTITVAPVVVTLPVNKTSFDIQDQVKISDPDSGDAAVPYVQGTAHIISATGPANTPAGIDLKSLVTVDPVTGQVTYDAAAFKFLGAGQTAVYTIGFDSQSGPDTVHETLTFTVDGVNDAPVVTAPLLAAAHQGDAVSTTNLLAGASDPDAGETATLSVTNVHYVVDGGAASLIAPAGVSLTGTTLTIDPKNAAFIHLAQGQTETIQVTYDVTDAHGATVTQTETLTVTGTNDAPTVGAALTSTTHQDAAAYTVSLLAGSTDPDDGETATLSVTGVHYSIDGGAASQSTPAGISLTGSTLSVDPTDPSFAHLAQGQTETVTVTYDVTDVHGATVTQTETVTVTGANDAPTVGAALTSTTHQDAAAYTVSLLAGSTDPDDGETATLSVTGVHYSIDGGAASQSAPAGISLTGSDLSVDPSDPSFAHLAQGQTETVTVTYDVTDVHGAAVAQAETVTVTGANDAPTVGPALTSVTHQGASLYAVNLLAGASDPDDGETAMLIVTNPQYSVDGGPASGAIPSGISLGGPQLYVDPSNPAYAHLAAGQTTEIVVTYGITDVHGATVMQTETITITGTNDAPVAGPALTLGAQQGDPPYTVNLLAGSTDPDDGETATLSVTDVRYAVGTGAASDTPPAGITLSGSSLKVDASNSAYANLLVGQSVTITVTYDVTDVHGATVSQTETITINGVNQPPPVATTTVWTGLAGNGNWNDPANWTPHAPTAIDTASFSANTSVTLASDITVAALVVATGVVLDVTTSTPAHAIDVTGSLDNQGDIVLHAGATLDVTGTVQNAGTITVDTYHPNGATLSIDGHVKLEGGGVVTLDGTSDKIAEHGSGAVLENVDNKIDGYGTIGNGHLTLVNDAGGIIAATDLLHGITVNTGTGTFTNHGLIVSASLFGGLEITGNLINDGTIEAHIGVLKIDGSVTGYGAAVIDGGALEFGGASNVHVQFTGSTADALVLDQGSHFTGTVTGFSLGDIVDLEGVALRNVHLHTNANGTITVDYGSGSFVIDGDYARGSFAVTTDLHGGTAIVWTDPPPQISTSDVELSQHGHTTKIDGLSFFDPNSGRNETFTLTTDTASGRVDLTDDSGRMSDINRDLQSGITYHDDGNSTATVAVTVADHLGASDTVNFVFNTNPNSNAPVTLTGTAGKDVIFATAHTDTLTGGASADQFVFATSAGNHTITDFTPGQDHIELDFAPNGSQPLQQWLAHAAVQQGPDTLITLDNHGDTLLLKHVAVADLHASDFIIQASQHAA